MGSEGNFSSAFAALTGFEPFPWQRQLALAEPLPSLVNVPTGLGKTAGVVGAWLWRRVWADKETRRRTPRRLVYCLPMRVLVEQTHENAVRWLDRQNLLEGAAKFDSHGRLIHYTPSFADRDKITVHKLMGAEQADDWELYPEQDMILIGTQDMLLSRALNRGYAASRSRWPMQFGLLNTDCLWVFDEIQLMGTGLATTTQLGAFRHRLGSKDGHGCHSVWMSATLDEKWLETVDFKDILKGLPPESRLVFDFEEEIKSESLDEKARQALEDRWNATKPLKKSGASMSDADRLAKDARDAHKPGTRTIVVVNTVNRACELQRQISMLWGSADTQRLALLHSRFRPPDREARIKEALADPPANGTIIVSTQVIEAGVDVSATTLFTELAPWASLVQRFGRCNRRGEQNDLASVHWIDVPDKEAAPYDPEVIKEAREQLEAIMMKSDAERNVGLRWLPEVPLGYTHTHVIRRKDLIDLFDTTPDLAGNDIDIDRFVRDIQETDVRVFWRTWDRPKGYESPPNDRRWRRVERNELCPVPVDEFKKFAEKLKSKVWRWDYLEGAWVRPDSIYPGQVYLVDADAGGYDESLGWGLQHKIVVTPLGPSADKQRDDDEYDDDGLSMTDSFERIDQHTDRVCKELVSITAAEHRLSISAGEAQTLAIAARWHDFGKAHEIFQIKIDDGQELADKDADGNAQFRTKRDREWEEWAGCRIVAKAPGKRWNQAGELVDQGFWPRNGKAKDGFRRHFRHELASALAVLQRPHSGLSKDKLSDEDLNLIAYLIAAHHGKVRLSIRSMPNELRPRDENGKRQDNRRFARGVWDGEELPSVNLGDDITAPKITLSLEPMELGLCEEEPFRGQSSWIDRVIRLRDTLGPFRLAYLEALLRAADMRASKAADRNGDGA